MRTSRNRRTRTARRATTARQALLATLLGAATLAPTARGADTPASPAQAASPAQPADGKAGEGTAEPASPAAPEPPAAAVSGPEPANRLPDIVVTSTRRSELLSKVPISVSAFNEEALDLRGAKDIVDVVRFTPGINIDAAGTNNISIRGISSSAGAGTTGIYLDDTPIQMRALGFNADDALPKAFDLERVEVLRGPQGTLFGAGAEGGAVRYIMAQPNMSHADIYARSEMAYTQGGAPSFEAGIAGGAPLIDNELGFRASVWYRHDGGWINRLDPYTGAVVTANANAMNTVAMRVAAKWAPNEDVAITPSVTYQFRRASDVSTYWPVLSDPSQNIYQNAWPTQRAEPDSYFLPALKIEADLGKATLISNTSYFTRYEQSGYDGTTYNLGYYQTFADAGGPLGYALPTNVYPFITASGLNPGIEAAVPGYRAQAPVTNQQQSFTQELRLQSNGQGPLMWTAGLFYSRVKQSSVEEIQDPMLESFFQGVFGTDVASVFGVGLLPNGDSYYNSNYSVDSQLAAFGEASLNVTERLKVTAGLRYSRTRMSFENAADGPQNFGPSSGSGQQAENPVTPKLSVSWQADRDDMFYATYAKGFRIGGANAYINPVPCAIDLANLGLTAAPSSYTSDTVKSYELGSKNRLGDKLRVATSLYLIRWSGIQQNIYLPTCAFQFTTNAGDAVSKGGDIQVEYAPTANWNFELAVGSTNARFSHDVGTPAHLIAAQGDAVEGAALGAAPPWTASLGVQYDFAVLERKSYLRLDYEYEGHSNVLTPTQDPRTATYDPYYYTPPASSFVSLRLGTTIDQWNVSAFVDNLFDAHPQKLDSSDPHSSIDSYNPAPPSVLMSAYSLRPRTFGLTMTYRLR